MRGMKQDGWRGLLAQPLSRRVGLRVGLFTLAGLLGPVAAACGGDGEDGDDEEDDD
jgi:hypothetical protein